MSFRVEQENRVRQIEMAIIHVIQSRKKTGE
jgi:hypothetical protein